MKSEARKDSTRHLKLIGQRAIAEGRDADTLVAEARRRNPTQAGIPVQWTDGRNQQNVSQSVLLATDRDVKSFGGVQPSRMCGQCRFFDLETGRKEIQRQRFYERLTREQEWQLKHLGAPIENMGLCGASDGSKITAALTNADKCDQFRNKNR